MQQRALAVCSSANVQEKFDSISSWIEVAALEKECSCELISRGVPVGEIEKLMRSL